MTSPAQDPARVERRRRKHERQAVVFGLLVAFLAVASLAALAVYTGAVTAPIDEPIQTPGAEAAEPAPVPCLPKVKGEPDGALPVPYPQVKLRVLNASDTPGLAAAHRDVLLERGFDVVLTGNLDHHIDRSELRFGTKAIPHAYTVAAQFPEMAMVLDDRKGRTIDLLVGIEYVKPLDEEEVSIIADQPLKNRAGCLPADEVTPVKQEFPVESEG